MDTVRTAPHIHPRQRRWLEDPGTFREVRAQLIAVLRHRFPRSSDDTIDDCLDESIFLLQVKAPAHVAGSDPMSRAWILKTTGRRIVRQILLQRQVVALFTAPQSSEGEGMGMMASLRPGNDARRHYDAAITSEQWLSMLPAIIAETVRMHVLEDYTVDEIAAHQNNSRDTVKKRLKQGYRQLRMIILRDG